MEYVRVFAIEFWDTLAKMSPYLLFGFLVAGLMSVWISAQTVERHLGGRGFWSVFKAALFGVPLPLCSCGVIPVSMSLYKHGAGKGATVSFLLSTPQTGVDSILVTYSLLGPIFAVFRPIAALLTGLFGGTLVNIFDKDRQGGAKECSEECCSKTNRRPGWLRVLRYGFITLPGDIGAAMLAGLLIAAFISAAVPEDYFTVYLVGGGGFVAMLVMLAVGIPVYVCATASVPVAAALISKGLNPGAAMVFLITGPATNAASFTTLWATLGKKSTVLYLVSVVVSALAAGVAMDWLYRGVAGESICAHEMAMPTWVENLFAAALLAVLGWGMTSRLFKGKHAQ